MIHSLNFRRLTPKPCNHRSPSATQIAVLIWYCHVSVEYLQVFRNDGTLQANHTRSYKPWSPAHQSNGISFGHSHLKHRLESKQAITKDVHLRGPRGTDLLGDKSQLGSANHLYLEHPCRPFSFLLLFIFQKTRRKGRTAPHFRFPHRSNSPNCYR